MVTKTAIASINVNVLNIPSIVTWWAVPYSRLVLYTAIHSMFEILIYFLSTAVKITLQHNIETYFLEEYKVRYTYSTAGNK